MQRSTPVAQHDHTISGAHGKRTCTGDRVADVFLRDAGSPRIRWTMCHHCLGHEPDVATYEAVKKATWRSTYQPGTRPSLL
ncbi:hypothetical protein [Streptomyces canus]|uniref:hypothetical protein n=1 Tax=Streptomyces canus TaxID=58343 RepID=UPI003715AD90